MVLIDKSHRDQFKSEQRRTGVTARKLLKARADLPPGLTASIVNRWIAGAIKTASEEHIAYVEARWAALPNKELAADYWMKLTKAEVSHLRSELLRVSQSPTSIYPDLRNVPEDLKAADILNWYCYEGRKIRRDHWDFVLTHLASLQDAGKASAGKGRYVSAHSRYPPISEDALAQLRQYRKKTGIGSDKILQRSSGKPEGLTAPMISSWLHGATKSADPAYVDFVLNAYRKLLRE